MRTSPNLPKWIALAVVVMFAVAGLLGVVARRSSAKTPPAAVEETLAPDRDDDAGFEFARKDAPLDEVAVADSGDEAPADPAAPPDLADHRPPAVPTPPVALLPLPGTEPVPGGESVLPPPGPAPDLAWNDPPDRPAPDAPGHRESAPAPEPARKANPPHQRPATDPPGQSAREEGKVADSGAKDTQREPKQPPAPVASRPPAPVPSPRVAETPAGPGSSPPPPTPGDAKPAVIKPQPPAAPPAETVLKVPMIPVKPDTAPARNGATHRSEFLITPAELNRFRAENSMATVPFAADEEAGLATHTEALAFAEWLTRVHRAAGMIGTRESYRLPLASENKLHAVWAQDSTPQAANETKPFGIVRVGK